MHSDWPRTQQGGELFPPSNRLGREVNANEGILCSGHAS